MHRVNRGLVRTLLFIANALLTSQPANLLNLLVWMQTSACSRVSLIIRVSDVMF